ncbi:MAG: transglycosylase SLT domain-containing protein [Gemmatimonadaceae bacterium]
MKDLRGTYVHRGDVERRKRRVRAVIMVVGLVTAGIMAVRNWAPIDANAEPLRRTLAQRAEVQQLHQKIAAARGDLATADLQLERWHHIFTYARRFHVDATLAAQIFDASMTEGIDPELAFPLVRLESRFKTTAVSPVGAIGLTQLMLPTARWYDRGVSREDLLEPRTNLRIGFRHLRALIRENHGDVQLALLIYNRGPAAVEISRELGLDPSNGYDRVVLKGYRGKGVID